MPNVMTILSQVQCPHGGMAILTTTNSQMLVNESPALLQTDMHPIVGCPFTVGVVYMPCVMVQWVSASTSLSVNGVPVVLDSSVGLCVNAAGAPQGAVIVQGGQPQMEAQ